MIKFSIKIDDSEHSLTKEDGIPIDKIGGLLESLFNAIDTGTGEKCTLGQIRGNCYALDFYTQDEGYLSNFVTLHKSIEEVSIDDLLPEEKKYANKLKAILGNQYYLKAYDGNNEEIASISEIGTKELPSYYYTTDTVYGIIIQLGRQTTEAKKHISIEGVPYKIFITKEQDLSLKEYYDTHNLRIEISQKRSTFDGHIVSAELDSFDVISQKNLQDNLSETGYIDFNLIKNTNSIEDILAKIYANKQ
ncbi:MAG: hypothetical protein EOP34_10650 [Rickettsiales bacterium]|nr:MAG: hypothetical protein EOP34_10650 [Rickettsiales bacterium]